MVPPMQLNEVIVYYGAVLKNAATKHPLGVRAAPGMAGKALLC